MVSRNLKKGGSAPLKFHRMERLHVVAIAAGMAHSMALTDDGTLFYWVSSDPDLRCQQVLYFKTLFLVKFICFQEHAFLTIVVVVSTSSHKTFKYHRL